MLNVLTHPISETSKTTVANFLSNSFAHTLSYSTEHGAKLKCDTIDTDFLATFFRFGGGGGEKPYITDFR